MDKLKKLMEAKKKSKLSPVEKDAKESVLRGLSDDMADMMKKKLGGVKKATIMADSPEGMKKGAELVKKIAGAMPDGEEGEEKPGMKDAAEHEEEMVEHAESDKSVSQDEEAGEEEEEAGEEKSKEELLAEIERLKAKIEKLS